MQVGGLEQAAVVLAGTAARPSRASSWEPEDLVAEAVQGIGGEH
jgi:hypothetical protein